MSKMLLLIIGRNISSACTSAESEFARDTSWPVGILERLALIHHQQVIVHLIAQVVLHAQRKRTAVVTAQIRHRESEQRRADQQQQVRPERSGMGDDHPVDHFPGNERDEGLRDTADRSPDKAENQQLAVPEDVPGEAAQPALLDRLGHRWIRQNRLA